MKNKKINLLILFIAMVLVLYFSLKDDFVGIIKELKNVKPIIFFTAILVFLLSLLFKAASLKTFIKKHKKNYSLKKAYQMTLIGQFMNGITPFQTGGQPFQIYLLKKDGIRISDATSAMIKDHLAYQTALILVGLIAITLNSILKISVKNHYLYWLIFLGFIVNFVVLIMLLVICLAKKQGIKIATKIVHFVFKFNIVKKIGTSEEAVNKSLENFYKIGIDLKNNKKTILKAIIFNVLNLTFLYLIPFVIFSAIRCNEVSALESFVSTAFVMLIANLIPIPGATGGIEYGFLQFFKGYATSSVVVGAMLLWRFVTYFLAMMIGFVTLSLRKEAKKDENRIVY